MSVNENVKNFFFMFLKYFDLKWHKFLVRHKFMKRKNGTKEYNKRQKNKRNQTSVLGCECMSPFSPKIYGTPKKEEDQMTRGETPKASGEFVFAVLSGSALHHTLYGAIFLWRLKVHGLR
jgi:hypothetical protein